MPYFSWEDNLSVGVNKFDEEHKVLISFINKLHTAVLMGDASDTIYPVLEGLIDYTEVHFAHEEDMMIVHKYPAFDSHKKEHEKFVREVLEFKQKLDSGKTSFSIALMSFLRDWLMNHIMVSDKAYSGFFADKDIS